MDESVVLHEIEILVAAIKEHGDAQEGGTWTIAFGKVRERVCAWIVLPYPLPCLLLPATTLSVPSVSSVPLLTPLCRPSFVLLSSHFRRSQVYEKTVDTLEALNGTLRAAKKRNIIAFAKQMLLKGPDDAQIITLLAPE